MEYIILMGLEYKDLKVMKKKAVEDKMHFVLRCEGIGKRRTELVKELEGICEGEMLGTMLFEGKRCGSSINVEREEK